METTKMRENKTDEKAEGKIEEKKGTLCQIDLVNFTAQSREIGDKNTAKFIDYFKKKNQNSNK
jgi:hypothetical protein